jgi:hypothetical protein
MVSHFIRLAGYNETDYYASLTAKGILSDQWRNVTHNLFKLPGNQCLVAVSNPGINSLPQGTTLENQAFELRAHSY